jgi:hypothetical protein
LEVKIAIILGRKVELVFYVILNFQKYIKEINQVAHNTKTTAVHLSAQQWFFISNISINYT